MRFHKTRAIVYLLLFSLVFSTAALAYIPTPDESNASSYIAGKGASCYATGNGTVCVAFEITGTGTMSMIGATTIYIYKTNGTCVATYTYYNYPSMMGYNKTYHYSSKTYQGVSGQSYYAKVTVCAYDSTGGDVRVVTTNTVTA